MNGCLQTENIFRSHFFWWRVLGILPTEKHRQLHVVYSIAVNVLVTVAYPLHLAIGLLQCKRISDIINSLAITLTSLLCSIKIAIIWLKFKDINEIFEIVERQEKRIHLAKDEARYYKFVALKNVRRVFIMFLILYSTSLISGIMANLIHGFLGDWKLLFAAYFPFDPYGNMQQFLWAHVYQLLATCVMVLQDISSDSFVSMQLALLCGQIHALNTRVCKLGNDIHKSYDVNNQELVGCIQDHKDLLLFRSKLEKLASLFMFIEIIIISLIMCGIAAYIVLFVSDPYTLFYYCTYFLSMMGEIFPMCYYGSVMELEFANLTYAIFSSNWLKQNNNFKKNIRIFAENTKKPLYMTAWLIRINLNSFIIVCKNAYSLFALIMNLK